MIRHRILLARHPPLPLGQSACWYRAIVAAPLANNQLASLSPCSRVGKLGHLHKALLKLKYNNAIADAVADLGRPEDIAKVFVGFQKYLYEKVA